MDHPTRRLDANDQEVLMDHDTRRLDANDPALPPRQRPCYECGGRMVEAGLRDRGNVQLYRLGTFGTFGDASLIQTWVCLSCGSVRLYAEQPAKLEPKS